MRQRHRKGMGERHRHAPFTPVGRLAGGRVRSSFAEGGAAHRRKDRRRRSRDDGGGLSSQAATSQYVNPKNPIEDEMMAPEQNQNEEQAMPQGLSEINKEMNTPIKKHKRGGRVHRDTGGASPQSAAQTAQNVANETSTEQELENPANAKSGGGKWIQGAIKHPGGLHRALHVPEGEKIPAKKLAKASHSENPRVRRMVGLAKTLKKMH